ncbi:MAG: carboxypeptidase-like regulatory domain-containing protein [Bryobacteraceae bacterium]|jgi:hypothetical protein
MRFGNRGYSRTALAGAILVLVFTAPLATAQSGVGGIQGIVQNLSGAAVPNAILLLKEAGGSTQRTVSGEDGKYAFANLPPGTYSLTAFAPGFQVARSEKISVAPGLSTELTVRLETGSVSELKIGPEIGLLSAPVTFYPSPGGSVGVPVCDLFPMVSCWCGMARA